jgi:hypothetical protein
VSDEEPNADDRAIARALDADADDGPVDEHLVDDYREVLAHMPVEEVPPRPELEDAVVADALARRPAAAPDLAAPRARRRTRSRLAVLGAAAVAAVVVGAFLFTTGSSSKAPSAHIQSIAANTNEVDALLQQPGSRTGIFSPSGGQVVIGKKGAGDIFGLLNDSPVEIVLETDKGSTQLGPATPTNGVVSFTVTHPELVRAVRLTTPTGTLLGRAPLG